MPHEEGGACMFWKSKAERFAERVRRRQEREAAELPVPEAPLALPGRLYPVDVAGGSFRVGGKPLVVAGVANSGLGTGMNVWDGALHLAAYLDHNPEKLVQGKRVLELGAGTGVAGLAAAQLGAEHVVLTDLPYALPNLRANADRNAPSRPHGTTVTCGALDWSSPELPPGSPDRLDLVIAADVVWVADLVPSLVNAFVAVTDPALSSPRVLLAHQTRSKASDDLIFALLDPYFTVERVPTAELPRDFSRPEIALFLLRRRSSQCAAHDAAPGIC